jgi:mRNA-degrading endonuclease YafQ of YafQ-DinJ toxin-antitoxin module
MLGPTLRFLIDLIEAAEAPPWGVTKSPLFDASFSAMLPKAPDLPERLARFLDIKLPNPLSPTARAGKADSALKPPFQGLWHCHLAPDVILIYRLVNRSIQLMLICQHADIEGKRMKATARTLAQAA